jgi:hypothetical protein
MRGIRSGLTAVALALLAPVPPAVAQGSGAGALDLGIYAGGAWSSDWYETRTASSTRGVVSTVGDGDAYGVGLTAGFGAQATYWLASSLGLRLHAAYLPSPLPEADDDEGDGNPVNNYLYDLELVLRPWMGRTGTPAWIGSLYAFAGGGGLTANLGGDSAGCEAGGLDRGACLPRDAGQASVGQGVLGIGTELIPLGRTLGIFAELAAHGYESPVHTGDGFIPATTVRPGAPFAISDDRFAVTTRLVAGIRWTSAPRP